jgi:DNA-binding transcriptional regulator LsrR (DeoR family)
MDAILAHMSMSIDAPHDLLLVQVARLFFEQRLTRIEIAARLSISRFKVARLLDEAIASGVVRLEFQAASAIDRTLSTRLEERYGLKVALVVDGPDACTRDGRRFLASIASRFIVDLLRPDDVVGIAWGRTMAAIAQSVPIRHDGGIRVVQLAGGSTSFGAEENPHEVSRLVARRLGAEHVPLFAPAAVESLELRDGLLAEPDLARTVRMWERVTIGIVGVGSLISANPDARSPFADAWRFGGLRLDEGEPVGETLLQAFTTNGRPVSCSTYPIAMSLDQLRAVDRVVVVAGGVDKAPAIEAVVRGGVGTILVTDVGAARILLRGDDQVRPSGSDPRRHGVGLRRP